MEPIYIVIALIVIVGILLERNKDPFTPPRPTTPTYEEIDGVLVGIRSYGDTSSNECIDVIGVKDGVVFFKNSLESKVETLPVQNFINKYQRFPNECALDIEPSD